MLLKPSETKPPQDVRVNVKRYGSIIGPLMARLGFAIAVQDGQTVRYINKNSLINHAQEQNFTIDPKNIQLVKKTVEHTSHHEPTSSSNQPKSSPPPLIHSAHIQHM